jgi:nucleotide-binding universal stress UspA family protein
MSTHSFGKKYNLMKKILLAFDGTHFSESTLQFAADLNKNRPVLIVGAFMPQTSVVDLWSYVGGSSSGEEFIPLVGDDKGEAIRNNIKRFESYCRDHSIEYRVHKDYFDLAVPELKKESRFADLLIINSQSFYENMGSEPNEYLKEVLHKIECPVLVVPDKVEFPVCNILAYDGSESSVFAIKQFSYILPELTNNETTLVYANENVDELLPEENNIVELVNRHFPKLEVLKFGADPKKYFNTWLTEKKAGILVSGAFGRSGISRLFHKSFVSDVIKEHKMPVFIAHR